MRIRLRMSIGAAFQLGWFTLIDLLCGLLKQQQWTNVPYGRPISMTNPRPLNLISFYSIFISHLIFFLIFFLIIFFRFHTSIGFQSVSSSLIGVVRNVPIISEKKHTKHHHFNSIITITITSIQFNCQSWIWIDWLIDYTNIDHFDRITG